MPSIHRRTLLGTIATGTVAGLAGCSSSCPDSDPPEPSAVVRPDDGGPGFDAPPTGAWPTPGFDAANTGYAPSRAIPTDAPSLRWRTTVPAPAVDDAVANASSPTVADGRVYLTTGDGVFALSLRDGTERWHEADVRPAATAARTNYGSGLAPPIVGDGRVYVATPDAVLALDAADGTAIWRSPDLTPTGTPAVADGAVFVPTADGVRSFDAADGTRRWEANGRATTQPAVAEGTVVVSGETQLGLDAATGDRRWEADVRSDAPPAVHDATVFLGAYEGVVGLDLADGRRRWAIDRGGGRRFSAPVVTPETVYAVERPGEAADATFALDRSGDGSPEPRWCSYAGDGTVAAAADGHAFALQSASPAAAASAQLVAFTARFGEATWGYAARDRPVAPALLDGGVVVTTRGGTVAALGGA